MTRGYVTDRAKAARLFGRLAVMAAALAWVLVLGACGPDGPVVTPTSSSASSSVPSVTTPPVPVKSPEPLVPDAMADPGEAGAIAAAKYFLELYDYAYNTWDLTQWNAISDPECQFCQSVVDGVGEDQAKGQYTETGPIQYLDIASEEPNADHAHYIVTIKANQGKIRTFGEGRTLANEDSPGPKVLRMAILWSGDSWRLIAVNVIAAD